MIYFWSIYFLIISLYCLLLISFSFAWSKKELYLPSLLPLSSKSKISVIIALRNEEENLSDLILALNNQTLSHSYFEAILVNDHSTDNTYKEIKRFSEKHPWIRAYSLNNDKYGKKEALQLGMSQASGELLAFTDGDCLPHENWLSTLLNFYISESQPELIIGMVDQTANSLLEDIFRLEFLSLILSSAGAASLGRPILCNGANLAIKASAIKTYSHNTNIPSGDDVFLLHHIKNTGGKIKLLKSPQHLVSTKPPANLKAFVEQRKRWASKSTNYKDSDTVIVSLIVFITNVILLASIIPGIYFCNYNLVLCGIGIKTLADFIVFKKGGDLYSYNKRLWLIPFISIVYPFYISLIGFTAIKKPFTWKGRKYS